MSEDDKPTKPAKEKVKDELTSTEKDNDESFDQMLQLKTAENP
jgi:hypothetical protein